MPLARFHKLDADKREVILGAAADEFAAHGFEGASINRIIAAAGISKGAIYYYFEDKTDLFVTVLEEYLTRSGIDWREIIDSPDADAFWARMRDVLERGWRHARENPQWIRLGKAFKDIPREMWSEGRLGEYVARHVGDLEKMLVHGQAIGAVRTDMPAPVLVQLAMAIDQPFDHWVYSQWDTHDEAGRRRMFRVGLENFHRMFLPFPSDMFAAWYPLEEDA